MKTFILALALLGCGDNNTTMMMANPLVGSWKANVTGGGTLSLNIKSDATYAEVLSGTDTSTNCQSTLSLAGSWTSTTTTVSATATSGTYKAINCTDTSMNMDRAAMANELAAYSISGASYTLSGNMLTITMSGTPLTFTKQ
jgi:hypothetical protein